MLISATQTAPPVKFAWMQANAEYCSYQCIFFVNVLSHSRIQNSSMAKTNWISTYKV